MAVEVPTDADEVLRRAARHLADYFQSVLQFPPIQGDVVPAALSPGSPVIRLQTAPIPDFRPDGYRITTREEKGRQVVSVLGPASIGVKYGVHRLLREMHQRGRTLLIPNLSIESNPWVKTRELFVAEIEWHPTPGEKQVIAEHRKEFCWENWDISRLERYIDLIDAMGYNSVMTVDSEVSRQYAGSFVTQEELSRKVQAMFRRAHGNGMGTGFTMRGQHGYKDHSATLCPRDPAGLADMKAYWDYAITKHGPLVDRWVLFWSDPGGCRRNGCTVNSPQIATNEFLNLLRSKGFMSSVDFCLWALRWGAWPGYTDWSSVVNAGVLSPEVGISMMRRYDEHTAQAISAERRKAGIWGWYTNDIETSPGLHVHTHILDNEFNRIVRSSAGRLLDWYSLEDNNHILNLPSLYVGAQKLWDPGYPADASLRDFCLAVWGDENGPKVLPALQAIADVRCGQGTPRFRRNLWPDDFMCDLGRGSRLPAGDIEKCNAGLRSLESVNIDPVFVPKLPMVAAPEALLSYIKEHLRYISEFAGVRLAYDEAMRPAREGGSLEETQRRMASLPALKDTVTGCYGAHNETFYYRILRDFASAWQTRTFSDNLAQRKKTSASGWFNRDPRFAPEHAVNGILCETGEEGWAAAAPGPAWLKIDLGSCQAFQSVRVYNRGYRRDVWDEILEATPTAVEVFAAEDDPDPAKGTTDGNEAGYSPIGIIEGWKPGSAPGDYREVRADSPIRARFVKLVFRGAANDQPPGCGEIEIR